MWKYISHLPPHKQRPAGVTRRPPCVYVCSHVSSRRALPPASCGVANPVVPGNGGAQLCVIRVDFVRVPRLIDSQTTQLRDTSPGIYIWLQLYSGPYHQQDRLHMAVDTAGTTCHGVPNALSPRVCWSVYTTTSGLAPQEVLIITPT